MNLKPYGGPAVNLNKVIWTMWEKDVLRLKLF